MVSPTLSASALFAFVAALVYAYVGWRLGQREVTEKAQRAATLFSVWWYGLAGTTTATGIMHLTAALDAASLPLFIALTYVNVLVVCVALLGLLYYLVYLFTGRDTVVPLGVFYAAYYVFLLYYLTAAGPTGVEVTRWRAALAYEQPLMGPLFGVVIALLVFPQLIGALAYLSLFFKVQEATQRYRILVVSLSIVVWFGSALAAAGSGLASNDAWQLASRFIGLGAAVAIYLAYFPPGWVRRRYGVVSLREQGA